MLGGQKTGRPQTAVQRLGIAGAASGGHDDVRRQVTVHRTETVRNPRADARPAGELKASLQKRDRRIVVDRLGMYRAHHTKLVRHSAKVGQHLAQLQAALAMCGKTVFRGGHRQRFLVGRHAGQPLPAPNRVRQFLTAMLLELRFWIKKIHLRRGSIHMEINQVFYFYQLELGQLL